MAEDNSPTLAELRELLPMTLRRRFDSLGSYVQSFIASEQSDSALKSPLSRQAVATIQELVFVYALRQLFREGSLAAQAACETFESLGVRAFDIGSTTFAKGSEATLRGARLAAQMDKQLSRSRHFAVVREATSIGDLIKRLIRELSNG